MTEIDSLNKCLILCVQIQQHSIDKILNEFQDYKVIGTVVSEGKESSERSIDRARNCYFKLTSFGIITTALRERSKPRGMGEVEGEIR